MQRKFLEDLGLEKEAIDKIMTENGSDIEKVKAERDTYKAQLDTAQQTLKGFDGVNVAELQGKITQLSNDLAAKDSQYQEQLAERDFQDLLKATASSYSPRDIRAVMPFLDVEKLKSSKNQEADIKAALDAVKKENAYLFQDVNVPRVVAPTPGPNPNAEESKTRANEALRNLLGRE